MGERVDLDAVDARANAATEGPWEIIEHSWSDTGIYAQRGAVAMVKIDDGVDEDTQDTYGAIMEADAEFIMCARADIPAMSAELRAARAEIAELRAQIAGLAADGWRPMNTAPLDETPVLLFTRRGVVEAWFMPPTVHQTLDGPEPDGYVWVCLDDTFCIEVENAEWETHGEALAWRPLPSPPSFLDTARGAANG